MKVDAVQAEAIDLGVGKPYADAGRELEKGPREPERGCKW